MAITTAMIKELRERTGAGMMDCKKALVVSDGDIDLAIENMRKSGAAKADKKSGRIAAEGKVVIAMSDDAKSAAIVEINCETDFAAKDKNFVAFAEAVAQAALNNQPSDVAALSACTLGSGISIEETRTNLIAKIGENMQVRRFQLVSADEPMASYMHGVKIAVVVALKGGDITLGKDIAMHIAATNPLCATEADVPAETLAKEKEILMVQARDSGKPENIIEKMIQGRLRKYLADVTLVGQPFVKDSDQTVGQLLKSAGAELVSFTRTEVGAGIEKKQEDFASEVMAQIKS